jgi:hypothetical protein
MHAGPCCHGSGHVAGEPPAWEQREAIERRAARAQGRVACEVNSGDELVATELIFAGVLAELAPEEAVALLSALVFQARAARRPRGRRGRARCSCCAFAGPLACGGACVRGALVCRRGAMRRPRRLLERDWKRRSRCSK